MDSLTSKKNFNVRMNDDAQLYRDNNGISRRDVMQCLEEYANKLNGKKIGGRIFDIGSADGSVTSILIKCVSNDYEKLIGCDINEKMVKFANDHHEDERTKFMVLDIEGDLPKELRESFDHVFSFFTFHWVKNQEKAFTNVFNLLSQGGDCLLTFFGQSSVYTTFLALSRTNKWSSWLTECDTFVSPYHGCHDPDNKIVEMLEEIGFHDIDVRCKQKVFVYKSTGSFKKIIAAVNPFKIPKELYEDFLDDFIEMSRNMRLVDHLTDSVTLNYNLFVIHCNK